MPPAAPREDTPITLDCPEVVYAPLDMRVVDARRLRAGAGREVEDGDSLQMIESATSDGKDVVKDFSTSTGASRNGVGCAFLGMKRGEIRTFRIVQKDSAPRVETYELRAFNGSPPRVRARTPLKSGDGPALESGDVATMVRTIRIDGVLAENEIRKDETAYIEGMGSLLVGLRVGDHVRFDVDGLYMRSVGAPLYDPNVRQKIEVDIRIEARVKTKDEVARARKATVEKAHPHHGPATCPPGTVRCPGGMRDSSYCYTLPKATSSSAVPTFQGCPRLP